MVSAIIPLAPALVTLATAWGFGRWVRNRQPRSETLALASGVAILSLLVFASLLAGIGSRLVFAVVAAVGCSGLWGWLPPRPRFRWSWAWPIGVFFGLYYLVHAWAPEIQPDGVTYHLGLIAEWVRLGHLPDRIGFYEVLPQGLGMVFGFAYAFGGPSAAKLVHFGLLIATVPLMVLIGKRLGFDARPAAVLFVCAPVVGISGTCTYTDAALVFFLLAGFLLLLSEDCGEAGLALGFAASVKVTGLIALPFAVLFLLGRRHWRGAALFSAGALLTGAPWFLRAWINTGNPLAPVANLWFPNPFFHYGSEQYLSDYLRSYDGITWREIPRELAFLGSRLQGLFGPVLLLMPLSLLALRRRAGRWLVPAAVVVMIPWFLNVGARFLMPGFAFMALALAAALPSRAMIAVALAHAVLCTPWLVDAYAARHAWRLRGFPWQAALRIEPEADYLRRSLWGYRLADMVTQHARTGDRLLDLFAMPYAYSPLVPVGPLPSAAFDNLADTVALAARENEPEPLYELRAELPSQPVTALRLRLATPPQGRWMVNELEIYRGPTRITPDAAWRLDGWPNPGDVPLAFDRNLATQWQTWEDSHTGHYIEVEFPSPLAATHAVAVLRRAAGTAVVEVQVRLADGSWKLAPSVREPRSAGLLRIQASHFLRSSGITMILVATGGDGHGITGLSMSNNPDAWGLEKVSDVEGVALFRLR